MTVETLTSRWDGTGDGTTTKFYFTNRIFAASDLEVYLDNELQTSGYSVVGTGDEDGGYVEFDAAPASGVVVVLVSAISDTQPTEYPEGDDFPSATHELALDRRTRVSQQRAADMPRKLGLAPGDADASIGYLPAAATRASKYLAFDAAGDPIAAAGTSDATPISAFGATLVDDADAAEARSTLGLEIGTDVLAPAGSGAGLSGVQLQTAVVPYTDDHTLTATDDADIIYMNKGSAVTLTAPQDSTENLRVGFQAAVFNAGAGQVTVAVEGADTLHIPDSKTAKLRAQYSWASVVKLASGVWAITGDLEDA